MEYKQWWREHRKNGLKLHEVQILASAWAAEKVSGLNEGSAEERKIAAGNIRKTIEDLRSRRLPVIPAGIFKGDSGTPISEERARAIRAGVKNGN
jgi:hypothetical protein